MNNILILTDQQAGTDILAFASQLATQNERELIVAETAKRQQARKLSKTLVPAGRQMLPEKEEEWLTGHKVINISAFTTNEIAQYIYQEAYDLVIVKPGELQLDLQGLSNRLPCPLMILPGRVPSADIKRMVYLTDLRYAQTQVIRSVAKFNNASLLLAHICEQGLPDLDQSYGTALFNDAFGYLRKSQELLFTHIRETDMKKSVDTLINTMCADLLVCSNRRFHFNKLLGDRLPKHLPAYISVPLMIFPC